MGGRRCLLAPPSHESEHALQPWVSCLSPPPARPSPGTLKEDRHIQKAMLGGGWGGGYVAEVSIGRGSGCSPAFKSGDCSASSWLDIRKLALAHCFGPWFVSFVCFILLRKSFYGTNTPFRIYSLDFTIHRRVAKGVQRARQPNSQALQGYCRHEGKA